MKKEDIIALPHDHLRQKSERVGIVSDDIRRLIDDMTAAGLDWESSRKHELCVGLAAIQVNKPLKVVILRADQEDRANHEFITMINPKIVKFEGEPELDYEGCLSVKEVYGKVPRYPKVKVKALDRYGQEFRVTAEGFQARLIQHEVDHTVGKLFIDHIKGEDLFYKIDDDGQIVKQDLKSVMSNKDLW